MPENNKENFLNIGVEYSLISLFSKKLNVGIIGAGRGGYIKAKHFGEQGCKVEVLAKNEGEYFEKIKSYPNIKMIHQEYYKDFIKDKHLIIIAIDDDKKRNEIKEDCEKEYKLYIDSSSFMDGMGSLPVQLDFDNMAIGINTRAGNPKGSRFVGNKIVEEIQRYDKFIGFTTLVRNRVKSNEEIKKSVTDFMASEDFYFFYENGVAKEIINMFYGEEDILDV